MESLMSNANNQIVVVRSKSHEEQERVSIEEGQSSESEVPAADMENNYQLMIIPEEEQEYGCKYCQKRFSNKQALGGHQNKHKLERHMEKKEQESGGVAHFAGHASFYGRTAPYLTSFCRSLDSWNFASQQTAAAAGFNNSLVYHGWSAAPRVPPCPTRPRYTVPQNLNTNLSLSLSLPNFGLGSSHGFTGFGMRSGVNNQPSTTINLRNIPEVNDESCLDLSLKL